MGRFGLFLAAVGLMLAGATSAPAAVESPPLRKAELAHMNPFASYDLAAVQRGFQVYNEVCAACHSVQYLYYRNLGEIGLSEAEVKAIAAEATVMNEEANEDGEMFERPGKPSDRIVKPFENDAAARAANGGALPPDHNPYFSGGMIAMAPPLSEDAVEYADGTKATVDQMARDVVTFLAWASEPTLVERRQMGTKVIIFLVIFSALMYAVKRKVWADVH